jgi:hypothetical protein
MNDLDDLVTADPEPPGDRHDRVLERSQVVPVELAAGDGGTVIEDRVVYRLPFEPLAGVLAPLTVGRWPAANFDDRAEQTRVLLG